MALLETLARDHPRDAALSMAVGRGLRSARAGPRGHRRLRWRRPGDWKRPHHAPPGDAQVRWGVHPVFHGCCHASLAGLANHDGAGIAAADASSHAETAMALLKKAAGIGYGDPDTFRTETALDPLRGREDFQLLLMDLTFPARPFDGARR